MSSDENSPVPTGCKRQGALQLGPRKKPHVRSSLHDLPHSDSEQLAVGRIPSCIMVVILGGQSIPCARWTLWSIMAFYVWGNLGMHQKKCLRMSMSYLSKKLNDSLTLTQGTRGTQGISTTSSNCTRPWRSHNGRLGWRTCTYRWARSYLYLVFFGALDDMPRVDSERYLQCEVGRHQEFKRSHPGLDYPAWSTSGHVMWK